MAEDLSLVFETDDGPVHALSGIDLTIRPGWAVGWYFVPLACLFMPLRAMKETWLASRYGRDWHQGKATDLLNWWWGVWLLTNILSSSAAVLHRDAANFAFALDLVTALIGLPLAWLFARLMQQVRDGQSVIVRTALPA